MVASKQITVTATPPAGFSPASSNLDDWLEALAAAVVAPSTIPYVQAGRSVLNINAAATVAFPYDTDLGTNDAANAFFLFGGAGITSQIDQVVLAIGSLAFAGSVTRYNGILRIAINGSTDTAASKCGYIRNTSGHTESSLHVQTVLSLAAGDIITASVQRESAPTAAVNTSAGQSRLVLLHLGAL